MIANGTDGHPLWYQADGDGPAVLLPSRTHGEHEALGNTLAAGGYRAVRYLPRDMPLAEPAWDSSTLVTYPAEVAVADLHAVADAAGADRFVLSGYSGTAAYAAFLAPLSARTDGLAVGGFAILGPHDYWLGSLEGMSIAFTSVDRPDLAVRGHAGTLMYRAWLERDDRPALAALPGPKAVWYGSADGEPGCAMYDDMRGARIGRRLREQAGELRALGFEVMELPGYDHLGAYRAVEVVPGLLQQHA